MCKPSQLDQKLYYHLKWPTKGIYQHVGLIELCVVIYSLWRLDTAVRK